jgi:cytochrome c553
LDPRGKAAIKHRKPEQHPEMIRNEHCKRICRQIVTVFSTSFRYLMLLIGSCCALHPIVASPFDEAAAVFANHCVRCHNDVDRKGDFSLQTADSLRKSDFVQPADLSSHLLAVIQTDGDDPPSMPKDAKPLSKEEVAVVGRWIETGADWPAGQSIAEAVSDFDWWSLKPLLRPEIPNVDSDWVRSPIDAFALRTLNEQGLTPAVEADRRALIRRLTYDLIGLPPAPAQVDAFIANTDPQAYEKLVDQLLESRHYGERWARHWLDVIKYADTCGYDKDKLRPNAWPYRDYVIRSLNSDKPYSRFVQEQVAGDVLFAGDPDGILGLGFVAAGPWDFIGHVEVSAKKIDGKVARNLDRDEMVSNTLNTFCSVTIQCARCHNHKFDPFTQEHYYSLQAVFAAVDRADRVYQSDSDVERQRSELEKSLTEHRSEKEAFEAELAKEGGGRLKELNEQISQLTKTAGVKKEAAYGFHSQMTDDQTSEKWVQIELDQSVQASTIVLHPCHDEFGGIGAGFGFPIRYKIEVRDDEASKWTELFVSAKPAPNPGLAPLVIEANNETFRYLRLTALELADRIKTYMFAIAEMRVLDIAGKNVASGAKVTSLDSIEAPVRWARSNLVDGKWARPRDTRAHEQLLSLRSERRILAKKIETPDRIERREKIDTAIKKVTKQLDSLPQGKLVYAASTSFKPQSNFKPTGGSPRPIHLLARGNVDQPLDPLAPGLLPINSDDDWRMSADLPEGERRAALAKWLTDKDNPLVWRSIVNRIWQYHFGDGLVATPNDFGRMGALPTHPELLDWLASEFRDGDQSFKQLHRLIVTSSLYRQSSRFDKSNARIDSGNQYLWRMNRRRLSAEEIRDSVLSVSGVLNTEMGGPGFYLFELEKTEHSPHYEYHKFDPANPESHRRSIYRFIVRSQPDPYMTTLDCADSSQSTPQRLETLTSLQALSLLNNRFNLEMASRFADRLRAETKDPEEQIVRAIRLISGRSPNDEEVTALKTYLDEHGLPNLCRMLFNLSEFVYLD